jgi:transposase
MMSQSTEQRIYLAAEPVDMRGGFDRLSGRVRAAGLDLYGGHLFVFISRRRTHLKVLTWDGSGLVVYYKRLSRGKFVPPVDELGRRPATLDAVALATLLRGKVRVRAGRSLSPTSKNKGIDSRGPA